MIDTPAITIRPLTEGDRDAVRKLAERDSNGMPMGELLGAELEGRLLAVVSLRTGEAIADPFSRTEEIRAMLELRRRQLRRGHHPARSRSTLGPG